MIILLIAMWPMTLMHWINLKVSKLRRSEDNGEEGMSESQQAAAYRWLRERIEFKSHDGTTCIEFPQYIFPDLGQHHGMKQNDIVDDVIMTAIQESQR